MHIRLALILVFSVASLGAASGQIFRTVDANGNVVFTDIPPVDRTGQAASTQVTVPQVNTVPGVPAPVPQSNSAPAATSPGYYTQFRVVSPANDATIRDNAGNVRVELAIAPQLRPDHRMLLLLDGSPTQITAVNGVFELANVDRGTRTVRARVVDRAGSVIIESDPTTFHLMRVAVAPTVPIAPPRPPIVN
jgi:Domain of unknown function (DUF4124)